MEYILKIREYIINHKIKVLKIGGIILTSLILMMGIYFLNDMKENSTKFVVTNNQKSKYSGDLDKNKVDPKEEEIIKKFIVDIKGAINKPGVYSLNENSRIMDVITLAGGLLDYADTSAINLSLKIKDEMVIIIYTKEQIKKFKELKKEEEKVYNNCKNNDVLNDACINKGDDNTNKVNDKININTASKELLMTLPGVGETRAIDIINYREKQKFLKIEDLMEISGIGDKVFARIKENITI